jgi:hypothetical protein
MCGSFEGQDETARREKKAWEETDIKIFSCKLPRDSRSPASPPVCVERNEYREHSVQNGPRLSFAPSSQSPYQTIVTIVTSNYCI